MEYETFFNLVSKYLYPMFSNTKLIKSEKKGYEKDIVVINDGGTILALKDEKSADRRIELKREIPFDPLEKKIAKSFIEYVNELFSKIKDTKLLEEYLDKTFSHVIAYSFSDEAKELIYSILFEYDKLADYTYEGNRITLSCSILNTDKHTNIKYIDLINTKHGLPLTNAYDTSFVISNDGYLITYRTGEKPDEKALCPFRYSMLSSANDNKEICINLNRNGEIIILVNGDLLYTKRRGKWQYYSNNTLYNMIKSKKLNIYAEISKNIYQSSLDVSFARCGGCIAIIEDEYIETVKTKVIKDGDCFDNPQNDKAKDLNEIVCGQKFHKLDRRIRMEILGIDGAVILDKQGNIITAGSIINISEASDDGARTAATKTLARYGIAIKISMDGEIKIYKNKENRIELAFQFG